MAVDCSLLAVLRFEREIQVTLYYVTSPSTRRHLLTAVQRSMQLKVIDHFKQAGFAIVPGLNDREYRANVSETRSMP